MKDVRRIRGFPEARMCERGEMGEMGKKDEKGENVRWVTGQMGERSDG